MLLIHHKKISNEWRINLLNTDYIIIIYDHWILYWFIISFFQIMYIILAGFTTKKFPLVTPSAIGIGISGKLTELRIAASKGQGAAPLVANTD